MVCRILFYLYDLYWAREFIARKMHVGSETRPYIPIRIKSGVLGVSRPIFQHSYRKNRSFLIAQLL